MYYVNPWKTVEAKIHDTTTGNRDGFTYGMRVTYTFHRLFNWN